MGNELTVVGQQASATTPMVGVTVAGTQITSNPDGTRGKDTILMATFDPAKVQRVLQFQIDNSGANATAQDVRFGSFAAQKDAYSNFGLSKSAADDTVITDDRGVGCRKIQAFGKFVEANPIVTAKIKILCEDSNQLATTIYHKTLQLDGSDPLSTSIDVAYTQSRSDNRTNLVEVPASLVLDSTRFLQYRVGAGVKLTFYIEVAAISNTETFTPLPGVML